MGFNWGVIRKGLQAIPKGGESGLLSMHLHVVVFRQHQSL
jgi:hypothetical protein